MLSFRFLSGDSIQDLNENILRRRRSTGIFFYKIEETSEREENFQFLFLPEDRNFNIVEMKLLL